MKRYLNQIRKFVSKNVSVPVMVALLLVGSVAVAKSAVNKQTTPNVYNDGGTASAPNWQPLPSGSYLCITSANVCTGYQATSEGTVTNIRNGTFSN